MDTAFERGWAQLRNGMLLDRAEAAGFAVLIRLTKACGISRI
ncbi:MAG: hypothetical protein OXC91_15680 [Rhodobacteraceae bacterium]|nr:hypothetical protein [Paracoccaceae bacterium]